MGGLLVFLDIDRMQLLFFQMCPIMWLSMRIVSLGKLILISCAWCLVEAQHAQQRKECLL